MVQCIAFSMFFLLWFILGENLPTWVVFINTLGLFISQAAAIVMWENHKMKVEKLEEELKRLKESQNG